MQTQLKPPSPEIAKEVVVRDPCAAQPQPKRTKFTPENVRQIINLVERGKSNDEIADIIASPAAADLCTSPAKLGMDLNRFPFRAILHALICLRNSRGNAARSALQGFLLRAPDSAEYRR
jgi:hypothetical protein